MKKLLLATAIVAFTCAHARASPTQLPDAMLGYWCPVPESEQTGHGSTTYVHANRLEEEECIEVTRTGFHGMEYGCKFGRIDKKVGSYIVHMRCYAAGDDQDPVPDKHPISASIFQLDNGKLTVSP
jgi:hypothetical protein